MTFIFVDDEVYHNISKMFRGPSDTCNRVLRRLLPNAHATFWKKASCSELWRFG